MLRGPSVRTESFRKVQNSTRLPSALLRELEDLEGSDAVSDTAETSNSKLRTVCVCRAAKVVLALEHEMRK